MLGLVVSPTAKERNKQKNKAKTSQSPYTVNKKIRKKRESSSKTTTKNT